MHYGKATHLSNDPKTWSEAMNSSEAKQWKQAAEEELRSLLETGAIEIIRRSKLSKGRTLMKCKWKSLADGNLDKCRARCTVRGFTQRSGIDYNETFAPTPRAETGTIMLALSHMLGWYRRQGDVPVEFLNPDLDVNVYMELPEGFKEKDRIIFIRKGLYGLKQAAALWHENIKAFLIKHGMFPSVTDVCLYTNKQRDLFAIVHVDDFQIMGPNINKIDQILQAL